MNKRECHFIATLPVKTNLRYIYIFPLRYYYQKSSDSKQEPEPPLHTVIHYINYNTVE